MINTVRCSAENGIIVISFWVFRHPFGTDPNEYAHATRSRMSPYHLLEGIHSDIKNNRGIGARQRSRVWIERNPSPERSGSTIGQEWERLKRVVCHSIFSLFLSQFARCLASRNEASSWKMPFASGSSLDEKCLISSVRRSRETRCFGFPTFTCLTACTQHT